jgi:cytochrome d ubiquinol oxidase subunit II
VVVGAVAFVTLVLSRTGAPVIFHGLTERPWTWPFHALTGLAALTTFWALGSRRYPLARLAVGAQVALVLGGWALSQFPYLVPPGLTLQAAAANPRTQTAILVALAIGLPVLLPSLWLLFRVFKTAPRR